MKILKDLFLEEKTVLLRLDTNIPISEKGKIENDFRLRAIVPTIDYLLKQECKIVILGSLGRPEGKIDENLRLQPIAERLSELTGEHILQLTNIRGQGNTIKDTDKRIILLENLRFCIEEEANNEDFAKELASYGEFYINDAFANSHRQHASMVGIPKFIPGAIGLLVEKEIAALSKVMTNIECPLVAVLGGAKLETKLGLVDKMTELADKLLLGGKLANEFLDKKDPNLNDKIILPLDVVGDGAYDIGEKTIAKFEEILKSAKSAIWNGPMGKFEEKEYSKGTYKIAKIISKLDAYTVVGGGETVDVIDDLGLRDEFNHVSTGGGAMLEFLEKGELPALDILK